MDNKRKRKDEGITKTIKRRDKNSTKQDNNNEIQKHDSEPQIMVDTESPHEEVVVSSNWKKLSVKLQKGKKPDAEEQATPPSSAPISASASSSTSKSTHHDNQQGQLVLLPKTFELPPSEDMSTTKHLAIDCEMVGVGPNGKQSALARVCILNSFGNVIYNKFVKPIEEVTDYRTQWSGIREGDLAEAIPFKQAQEEVAKIIKKRIIIGHDLRFDLKALMLVHKAKFMRDTARWRPFMRGKERPHGLKHLMKMKLGVTIQSGEHDPIEDARSSLLLYKAYQKEWEKQIADFKYGASRKKKVEDVQEEEEEEEEGGEGQEAEEELAATADGEQEIVRDGDMAILAKIDNNNHAVKSIKID